MTTMTMSPSQHRNLGAVVFEGPPAELVDHPASVTAEYLRRRVNA